LIEGVHPKLALHSPVLGVAGKSGVEGVNEKGKVLQKAILFFPRQGKSLPGCTLLSLSFGPADEFCFNQATPPRISFYWMNNPVI
jgi:hypothetical protein